MDDDAISAWLLVQFLQMIGHQAESLPVTSIEKLIAGIFERKPDVAFLDIGLCAIDGRQIAAELRERGCDAHLVAVSGWASQEDEERSIMAGFYQHWCKPLDIHVVEGFLAQRPLPSRRRPRHFSNASGGTSLRSVATPNSEIEHSKSSLRIKSLTRLDMYLLDRRSSGPELRSHIAQILRPYPVNAPT